VHAPAERIPAQVDWRGTGADGPVKVVSAFTMRSVPFGSDLNQRPGHLLAMLTVFLLTMSRTSLLAARAGRLVLWAQRRARTTWPQVQIVEPFARGSSLHTLSSRSRSWCRGAQVYNHYAFAHVLGPVGEQRLFSEQQLMDCSWGHTHNKACDGGLYEGAYHYLTHGDGVPLALQADYPCELGHIVPKCIFSVRTGVQHGGQFCI
jgi:Papain family cysteine protease